MICCCPGKSSYSKEVPKGVYAMSWRKAFKVEYAHAMNISHDELTWLLGLQQEAQGDHQAKVRAAQQVDGGPAKPQQIRAIMLGRLDKMNDMKFITNTS